MAYDAPPMRSGIFCWMDERVLDQAGWSFFDDLDGDISAPDALPLGGVKANGMFGFHTGFVPREHEAHESRLKLLQQLRVV